MGSEEKREQEGMRLNNTTGREGVDMGEMGELRNEKEFKMARVLSDFCENSSLDYFHIAYYLLISALFNILLSTELGT